MKILINGYHYGGNTPPVVKIIKELGHEVKLISPTIPGRDALFKLHKLSEDIDEKDLLIPSYSYIEKKLLLIFRVLNKLNLHKPAVKYFSSKVKKEIESFKPDIIWNHTFTLATNIMLNTGFRPQVSLPFGSEIFGPKASESFQLHQEIINKSDCILCAQSVFAQYLIDNLSAPESKIYIETPFGLCNLEKLITNNKEKADIRKKYNIAEDKIVLIDARGLRRIDGGSLTALIALGKIDIDNLFLILTKGILGADDVIKMAKEFISKNKLENKVLLIEDEVTYEDMIDLYKMSDIFLSLLPTDVLGLSIAEAISQDCQLVLTNLESYKIPLGNNAEYIRHDNVEDLVTALYRTIHLSNVEQKRRIESNKKWVIENACIKKNCEKVINLFDQIIKKNRTAEKLCH